MSFGSVSRWALILAAFVLVRVAPVVANGEHGVTFLYPTGGEIFYRSDFANVTYTSPFSSPLLFLFCKNSSTGVIAQVKSLPAPANNGSMLISMNFAGTDSCWFDLRPTQDAGNGANSNSFAVVLTDRAATTLGLPFTTAPTTTTAAPTTAAATTSPAPSPSSSSASQAPSGISNGAIAGICVGTALVAIILGGLAVAWWFRRRKRAAAATATATAMAWPPATDPSSSGGKASTYSPGNTHSNVSYLSSPSAAAAYAGTQYAPSEVSAAALGEPKGGSSAVHEMPNSMAAAELPMAYGLQAWDTDKFIMPGMEAASRHHHEPQELAAAPVARAPDTR